MKHDWEWRSFEACLEKVIYTKKLQSSDYLSEGKHPVVSQEEGLISGFWNNDDDIFEITKPLVIFGDHTRVLKYINFNFVLGADGVKILQPIDDIRAKFLYYYLKWFNVPSLGYSRHYKLLKECSVPVPSLSVQQQIVSELDKVSEIIEKKKQQVKELDNLAQSIFYDMFGDPVENEKGWEVKKYGEVFIIGAGGTPSKSKPEYWEGGDIPWIGSNMCQNQIIYQTDGKYITNEGLSHSSAKILEEGTVLVALVGATIGKVGLLKTKTATNQNIAFVKVDENQGYNPYFVYYQLQSLYGLFMSIGNGDFKMANQGFIKDLPIITPPFPLQRSFAQKIEVIEKQKELITASIKEAQTLFDARMDYWFGE